MVDSSQSWIYASLAELAYRKDVSDFSVSLDWFKVRFTDIDFSSSNLGQLNAIASSQGLLNFERSEDQSGDFYHFWNKTGFSAFVLKDGANYVISFRGTDVGVGQDMAELSQMFVDWKLDGVDRGGAINLSFQDWLELNAPKPGVSNYQNIDAGDWYTNVMLGMGTYRETQYDYAATLVEYVINNLANGANITVPPEF